MTEGGWSVSYTQNVIDFIIEHVSSERVANKLFEYRSLLEKMPDLGKVYSPEYAAELLPFECREIAVPDTPFTIYYLKKDAEHTLVIFWIGHQRVDPSLRFSGFDYSIIDW